jgi:hypothetical protein
MASAEEKWKDESKDRQVMGPVTQTARKARKERRGRPISAAKIQKIQVSRKIDSASHSPRSALNGFGMNHILIHINTRN